MVGKQNDKRFISHGTHLIYDFLMPFPPLSCSHSPAFFLFLFFALFVSSPQSAGPYERDAN